MKISIITVCYNSAKTIEKTFKSVKKVVKKVAPVAMLVPGVGTALGGVLGGIGSLATKIPGIGGALGKLGTSAMSGIAKLGIPGISSIAGGTAGGFGGIGSALTTKAGLIVSASAEDDDPNVHVGINIDEERDLPLTYNLEVSGSIRTSAAVFQSSDERLKSNIETIENGLNRILSSRGVTFDRIDKEAIPRQTGLIAQELEKVLPEAVETNELSGIKSVAYGNVVGLLVEAIKELKEEINELKKEKNNGTTSVRK